MTFAGERLAIESRLNTLGGNLPEIAWANVSYRPTAGQAYMRVEIQNSTGRLAGLGSSADLYRYRGIIAIDLIVPEHTGTETIRDYMDALNVVFRNKQFDGITTMVPQKGEYMPQSRKGWYKFPIAIPFYRDEVA